MSHAWDESSSASKPLARFHPSARSLLPDAFFWDCNDFDSPVGNDDGADVLLAFRHWKVANPGAKIGGFLDNILSRWQLSGEGHLKSDDHTQQMHDRVILGLAFAQIMVDGQLDTELRSQALHAVQRQKEQAKADAQTYNSPAAVYQERLRKINRIYEVINQV